MKLKTLLFSLACFFPALAQASEVEFIYSGRIDSLYGYNVPAGVTSITITVTTGLICFRLTWDWKRNLTPITASDYTPI